MLLAAHLLAHAIQQHLLRPKTYPLLRVIGDLIDLLPTRSDWSEFRSQFAWIRKAVSPLEFDATEALCLSLANGTIPATDASNDSAAGLLLRHLIAGALDERYADNLRRTYLRTRIFGAFRDRGLIAYVGKKLRFNLVGRKRTDSRP